MSVLMPVGGLFKGYNMHTVLSFCFANAWRDVTVVRVAQVFGATTLTPDVDAFGLSNLCLLVANRATHQAIMPQLSSLAPLAPLVVDVSRLMNGDA